MANQPNDIKASLDWLNTSLQYAKGVGPQLGKIFAKLSLQTFEDLLYHFPFRYLDYRSLSNIKDIQPGKNQVVMGEVYAAGEVMLGRGRKKIFEVVLSDGLGHLSAKWFRYNRAYHLKRFKKGAKFLFFGEIVRYRGEKQMIHPEVRTIKDFFDEEDLGSHLGLIPVYPATEGLQQRTIRKVISGLLEKLGDHLDETLPANLIQERNYPSLLQAITTLHQPGPEDSLAQLSEQVSIYHQRLAFEELFYLQLGLGLKKRNAQVKLDSYQHLPTVKLRNQLISKLPFELTQSQIRAVEGISFKMASQQGMNVLLQGDVGSGKTLVGMMAALVSIENAYQVALMVPTEILAEQHNKNFHNLLTDLGVQIELLTSSTKTSERTRIAAELAEGKPLILIGTHALIEEAVNFKNLSLVIIDEQHRFGVRQRMKLMRKGKQPDVLVMTATPIPRSLAMTLYGDLDIILMTELPRGRRPIQTRIMREKNRPKLYKFLRERMSEGRQIYFVLPLIEESEKLDLKDATQAFERLTKEFPKFKVGLIHGRMKSVEKDQMMQAFSQGDIQILVATTVIEVGIDVPNATVMVIEHAERFGLSQLHQLRGRVGRGSEKSYCILATDYRQSEVAKTRLKVMEESTDGFRIAEEDLKIRGPGDFMGTRQSGIPDLRVANLIRDLPLLEEARKLSSELLAKDPELSAPEHQGMRLVLKHRWQGRLGLATIG